MNADSLYSCRLCPSIHLMVQIAFGKCEQSCMLITFIKHSKIIFHLTTEKFRQFDYPVALFRLGTCNIILALQMLIRFVNCQFPVWNTEITLFQCKEFAFPNSSPIKDFKGIIGNRFLLHDFRKLQIFLFRPEKHFFPFCFPHFPRLL